MFQVLPHSGEPGTSGSALRAVKAQIQQDNDNKTWELNFGENSVMAFVYKIEFVTGYLQSQAPSPSARGTRQKPPQSLCGSQCSCPSHRSGSTWSLWVSPAEHRQASNSPPRTASSRCQEAPQSWTSLQRECRTHRQLLEHSTGTLVQQLWQILAWQTGAAPLVAVELLFIQKIRENCLQTEI